MNERIQELAEQAAKKHGHTIRFSPEIAETLDSFAELIVFECVNAVMDGTKEGDHYAMQIENHFDSGTGGILHFGVEE